MFFLETDRLKLIPLTYLQLLACQQNRAAFEQSFGLQVSAMRIGITFKQEINEAIQNFCIPNTKAYPDLYLWYTNWEIVLKDINTSIGNISLGGYPDDYGETFVGYVIDEQYWNLGYATEALTTLLKWGFSFSILKIVNADTPADNYASQKVLLKCGFKQVKAEQKIVYFKLNKLKAV